VINLNFIATPARLLGWLPGAILSVALATVPGLAQAQTPAQTPASAEQIKRGAYLATAADCAACHTVPKTGKPFAGGYGIDSPLGTIYSSNITPSKNGGIGSYTEAQFERALRDGVRADGAHLYPAMPYTSYAKLSDDDVQALYAYFMQGVPAVDGAAPKTALPFPFNLRFTMAGWNLLFLDHSRFKPEPAQSVAWNRGAYLVGALEHCSACHTPRNAFMAEQGGNPLAGGQLGAWYAPNLTSDPVSGLGGWSQAEMVQYLRSGQLAGRAQAAGPMAEAVQDSLQYLTDDDLNAIATYLKTVPAIHLAHETQAPYTFGAAANDEVLLRGTSPVSDSNIPLNPAELFSANCASCHQAKGLGTPDQYYPSLAHNTALGHANPSNLVAVILHGVDRTVDGHAVFMPGFGADSLVNPLSDEEIAAVSNYTLQRFGNPAVRVSAADVAQARNGGPPPLLARVSAWLRRIAHFL